MSKTDLILLALDDSAILNLMQRTLISGKYEIAVARDTESLSKIIQESIPSLLLIGEKFHGHEGLKIAKELLERFPTIPVLMYASEARPELIKGILRLGLSGFLVPPLRTADIVDSVETSLRNAHRVGDWLTGNLLGPLVVNLDNCQARQVVLTEKRWSTRQPLLKLAVSAPLRKSA